jgi:uncharacterized protein
MSDGERVPASADGMGAFEVGGFIRLVRNHEVPNPGRALGRGIPYDAAGAGGTTTLIVDPVTRGLVRDFVSLSGTVNNCSGGVTPWGSWISCEETFVGPEDGFDESHGYCFEIPAAADMPVDAPPLHQMGRFAHEAIAVDPRTGIVYLTEDRSSAGFYRHVPHVPSRLDRGGRLQMLALLDSRQYDASRGQREGEVLSVTWVDIPHPDPPHSAADNRPVFNQGYARGGARFKRLEGAAYGDGGVYFASTTGGDLELGQIWRYRPVLDPPLPRRRRSVSSRGFLPPEMMGELTLLHESRSSETLEAPDNICFSPDGSIVICEDRVGGQQHLHICTPEGDVFELARNELAGYEESEFAGATFSPDGQTLFVNIYGPSMTLAIWGPWRWLSSVERANTKVTRL